MSFQAYLDNIKAKTGKTPADFKTLAEKNGLTKVGEIRDWLKAEFGLGHGHAMAIAGILTKHEAFTAKPQDRLDKLFQGAKEKWRKPYETLLAKVSKFGPDVATAPTSSYISLLRGKNKFGIAQPSTADRFDIGIKLKGAAPEGRFKAAGDWNSMVTHRVSVADSKEIDAELIH